MQRIKKFLIKTLLIVAIAAPVAAFAHYLIFPQETRSILIRYSSFEKKGSIYFNPATPRHTVDSLQKLIEKASVRVATFWGGQTCQPDYIYCYQDVDFKKYGSAANVPACTYLKLGTHIVLGKDGLDSDIIAHEISHAEFYSRIGFYNWTFAIPSWFKHGLAMQNDYRDYYSEDTLKAKTNRLQNLPDIQLLVKDDQFYTGTREQVMLNYMLAKHEVKNWYTKEKLDKLIAAINEGESFEEAYGK